MKMKASRSPLSRLLTVVLSAVLTTSFIVGPAGNASAADTETPVMSIYSLSATQVTPGQQVTFSYVATEAAGALSRLRLGYRDLSGHHDALAFDGPLPVAGSVTITVPDTWWNGLRSLYWVELADPSGNTVQYDLVSGRALISPAGATGPAANTLPVGQGNMTVSGATADSAVPTLSSVSVSGSPAVPGQSVSLHYEATDAAGALKSVTFGVYDPYNVYRPITRNGTLPLSGVLDLVIPATWPNGAYLVKSVDLTDPSGNRAIYVAGGNVSKGPPGVTGPTTHSVDFGAARFEVTGSTFDSTPPTLTSVKLTGSTVRPGASATLSYTGEAQDHPLTSVSFRYSTPGGTQLVFATAPPPLTGTLPATMPDFWVGTYTLLDVTLQDSVGNTITYRRDGTTIQLPSQIVGTHAFALAGLDILVETPPSPPWMGVAAAHSRSALVSWVPNGPPDSSVTGYTVTAQPGGRTASANRSATEVEITGLTNGISYRFTVAATGVVGAGPASALSNAVTPRMSTNILGTWDFSGDGRSDLIGLRTDHRTAYLYRGNGAGGFAAVSGLTHPFDGFGTVFSAGRFDGSGLPNILGINGDGWLLSARGNGRGALFSAPWVVGPGWGPMPTAFGPGDFSGDRKPDVLAVKPDGSLYLYRGNNNGLLFAGQRIGSGWSGFLTVFSPGDFTGDGKSDVMAVSKDGGLYLYRGNGLGGFAAAGQRIGSGWGSFISVFSGGDFSGDHKNDVMAVNDAGALLLYRGNGRGGWASPGQTIGKGWTVYR